MNQRVQSVNYQENILQELGGCTGSPPPPSPSPRFISPLPSVSLHPHPPTHTCAVGSEALAQMASGGATRWLLRTEGSWGDSGQRLNTGESGGARQCQSL